MRSFRDVPSHLDVTGNIQVNDVHRWDLLPQSGGGLQVAYKARWICTMTGWILQSVSRRAESAGGGRRSGLGIF